MTESLNSLTLLQFVKVKIGRVIVERGQLYLFTPNFQQTLSLRTHDHFMKKTSYCDPFFLLRSLWKYSF